MRVRTIVLLAASAVALGLTSAASAQDYGPYGPGYGPPVATVPTDQVIVVAPRYRVDHHSLNTLIENVSLSQPVRTDDLDLRTWQGARELRRRIHRVASNVCGQLIDMYPVGRGQRRHTCYRNAVAGGHATGGRRDPNGARLSARLIWRALERPQSLKRAEGLPSDATSRAATASCRIPGGSGRRYRHPTGS